MRLITGADQRTTFQATRGPLEVVPICSRVAKRTHPSFCPTQSRLLLHPPPQASGKASILPHHFRNRQILPLRPIILGLHAKETVVRAILQGRCREIPQDAEREEVTRHHHQRGPTLALLSPAVVTSGIFGRCGFCPNRSYEPRHRCRSLARTTMGQGPLRSLRTMQDHGRDRSRGDARESKKPEGCGRREDAEHSRPDPPSLRRMRKGDLTQETPRGRVAFARFFHPR